MTSDSESFLSDSDDYGTPLHTAIRIGELEPIKTYLDQKGSTTNVCDHLHLATSYGQVEVARLLITRYNCPVDCRNKNKQTALHIACGKGHLDMVRMLFTEYQAKLTLRDENNDTPLHEAAQYGQTEVVNCLINEFSCNPSSQGIEGKTILHYACHQGHTELVETLLTQYGPDLLSISDDNGNTPLHSAALGGDERVVELLVTKYNCPLNCENSNKETPLAIAWNEGHLNVLKLMVIEHKADWLHSALHIAAWHGKALAMYHLIERLDSDYKLRQFESVPRSQKYQIDKYFLTSGKTLHPNAFTHQWHRAQVPNQYLKLAKKPTLLFTKYDCKQTSSSIIRILVMEYKINTEFERNSNACTPLYEEVWYGNTNDTKAIEFIINEFCSPQTIEVIDGRTMLNLASQQGYIELIKPLLTQYSIDPLSIDNDGNTPLHYAAWTGREDIVELFITKYKCPANVQNNNNQTPLHFACSADHVGTVRILVTEHKADLYIQDKDDNMPLYIAAWNGHTKVVKCLIDELNCDLNTKGHEGRTILHHACHQGHVNLVERLLTHYKLDPMTLDDSGNTPLHYAALSGKEEMLDLLITKYSCPVNHTNNNGDTSLHLACRMGYLTLVRMLVIRYKADFNICNKNNDTPLQEATLHGKAAVVNCLLLEYSCDCGIKGNQERNLLHYACLNDHDVLVRLLIDTFHLSLISADSEGNSPLHISSILGQNECVHTLLYTYHAPVHLRNNSGKSALEVARDVGTKKIINTYLKEKHNKIQDEYKIVQSLSSKKYSGAQKLTRVFVLGNVLSGKSTLIESLKREGFFSSWNQVSEATVPLHTSGIIPSEYSHKTVGRVLYYDFAGDPEYYSSHSAIMSSVMQSKEGTNVCLVLVNFQKDAKDIHEELGYWLSFISYHCVKLREKSKVVTIGSHVDSISKIEAKEKVELVSRFTQKFLSQTPKDSFEVVKECLTLNCRKPRSSKCVYTVLDQIVKRAGTCRLSVEAAIVLGLLEKDFKNVVTCKLQTLLTHIMDTGVHLPNTANSLYPIVMELHTLGLLMVFESKSGNLEEYLLLLNVLKLTNEVHKLLFSKDSTQKFISSTDPHSASMGILPQTYLNSILPEFVTTECLVQLQYCQEFSHAEVKFDYSIIPTEDSNALRLLYFPALCETERKNSIKTPDNYDYSIGWYVKCCGEFDYLPPRFLHVLLLRLAHSFALPAACDQPSSPSVDPEGDVIATVQLYNRRCTMWKNGIHWLMMKGVECFVENVSNSKGIVVITKSEEARKTVCTDMLFNIIGEIRQAKEEFCGTVTLQEYTMNSDDPAAFINEDKLFHASDIAKALKEGSPSIVSADRQGRTQINAAMIAHLKKYIHWGKY